MNKTQVRLLSIGQLPMEFSRSKVKAWQSSIFELVGEFDSFDLCCNSDSDNWVFSDDLVRSQMPETPGAAVTIALVSVPLEQNWYARRLGRNQIVFTFHEVKDILAFSNIPLENIVFRMLYAYVLLYRRSGNQIPEYGQNRRYTHDETRGCLFDFNGIKTDLVASCVDPVICVECQESLRRDRVSNEVIQAAGKEIKRIRRDLYYRVAYFIRRRPLIAFFLATMFSLALGTLASVLATFLLGATSPA